MNTPGEEIFVVAPSMTSLRLMRLSKISSSSAALLWNRELSKFLATAVDLLPYAFEKSDAQEKYGRENVFNVALGGRSLRLAIQGVSFY